MLLLTKEILKKLPPIYTNCEKENNQIKVLMAEAEKETLKEETLKSITPKSITPKSIPPKSKETVVIQTKKMTLRNPNAGRPGRKPRSVTTNNQKET